MGTMPRRPRRTIAYEDTGLEGVEQRASLRELKRRLAPADVLVVDPEIPGLALAAGLAERGVRVAALVANFDDRSDPVKEGYEAADIAALGLNHFAGTGGFDTRRAREHLLGRLAIAPEPARVVRLTATIATLVDAKDYSTVSISGGADHKALLVVLGSGGLAAAVRGDDRRAVSLQGPLSARLACVPGLIRSIASALARMDAEGVRDLGRLSRVARAAAVQATRCRRTTKRSLPTASQSPSTQAPAVVLVAACVATVRRVEANRSLINAVRAARVDSQTVRTMLLTVAVFRIPCLAALEN